MLAFALTLHLMQPQLHLSTRLRRPGLPLADNAAMASAHPQVDQPRNDFDPDMVDVPNDPHRGSVTAAEFGAAALGSLIANGLSIGLSIAIGNALSSIDDSILIGALIDLAIVPLAAGLSASWAAPDDASGSVGSAAFRAGLVHLGALGLLFGLTALTRTPAGIIAFALADLVAVPLAASWGMHSGIASAEASPAAAARSEMPAVAAMRPMQQVLGLRFQY